MSLPFHRLVNEIEVVIERQIGNELLDDFGRKINKPRQQVKIWANIQPVTNYRKSDVVSDAGGEHSSRMLKLYSRQEIKVRKEGLNGWNSDRFVYPCDGETYEIVSVSQHTMRTLVHYHALAKRVERT